MSFMILNWVKCIFVWGINETKGPTIVFCSKPRRNNTHLIRLLKFPHRHVLEIKKKRNKAPWLKISIEKTYIHSIFKIKIKCIYRETDILLPESYLTIFHLRKKKNCNFMTYLSIFNGGIYSKRKIFVLVQKSLFIGKSFTMKTR